jgi:hypothetical protein
MTTNLKDVIVFTAHARDPICLQMGENELFPRIKERVSTYIGNVSLVNLYIGYMVHTVLQLRALIKSSQQPDPIDTDPQKTLRARMYRRALAGEPSAPSIRTPISDLVPEQDSSSSIHFVVLIGGYHISYVTSRHPFLTIF